MSEIADYERRINAALARIGEGVERFGRGGGAPAGGPDGAEAAALREALEAERGANAQLTERVRAIKDRQETMVAALEKKAARLTQQLDAAGGELQRQKRVNGELTETLRALREAGTAPEPHLVNRAMLAELEALRAARAAERAEMEDILAELEPYIGEEADA